MIKTVGEHLFGSKSVALFIHVNPDWDCLGSAMALRHALRNAGVKCDIFTPTPLSFHLGFMETDVITFSEAESEPDYECYCAIDVSVIDRLGGWATYFENKTDTACIDHHLATTQMAKYSYIEHTRSATGELIFELITQCGYEITKDIASYLYCAISSDTGSFQYSSVTIRTYEILIELTKVGIDSAYLSSMLYERKTLSQMKLQGEAVSTLMLYGEHNTIATAQISNETILKYGACKQDTEFLAQLPRMLAGVMISAFFTELPNGDIRVNLRAQGNYNIEPVARIFGGGGHKKASGCTISGMSLVEAEKAVVKELLKIKEC